MNDFPWYPQIDGCRECGATEADACTCPGNPMYVSDGCPVHGPDALPHLYPPRSPSDESDGS